MIRKHKITSLSGTEARMFKQYARKRRLSDDEKETVGIKKAKKQTNNLIFNKLLIVDYY